MVVLVADAVHVTLVLVRVLTVRVLAVAVRMLAVPVRVRVSLVAVRVLAALVLVADAVHVTLVRVRVTLVLAMAVSLVCMLTVVVPMRVAVRVIAVAMLVITMFVHAVSVLVVAVRVIVLVSQVRLLVPERRHKRLTKSMTQQVAADKHAPGLFLRFVTRNRPCALYQVKLDPLIAARQRSLCARKLSKYASRGCIQKPNQVRWTGKLSVSESHSLQVRLLVLLASWIFKNRAIKRASQKTIPPLVGNVSIRRFGDNLCLRIHLCRKLLNGLGSILTTWRKL